MWASCCELLDISWNDSVRQRQCFNGPLIATSFCPLLLPPTFFMYLFNASLKRSFEHSWIEVGTHWFEDSRKIERKEGWCQYTALLDTVIDSEGFTCVSGDPNSTCHSLMEGLDDLHYFLRATIQLPNFPKCLPINRVEGLGIVNKNHVGGLIFSIAFSCNCRNVNIT